uniref:PPIase cyclophilin-type domain-containing protein n=1 Tax=Kalanchoe fedtschenkoi TaxID=63787 RepID=A0A7N0U920_KALFE
MAPGNKNPAVVLSEKVGVSLEEGVANLELLKKSLEKGVSASSSTDQSDVEAEREELKAEKLELLAERAEFKAEKLEWEAAKGSAGSSSTNSDLEAANAQLEADKLQLEALKAQLKAAESKLKDCHAELEAAKSELETAHEQLDEARAELETARSHLEAAKAQADINSTKLEAAKASLEAAKASFQAASKQLDAAKSRFEAAQSQLDSARGTLEADRSDLEDQKAALEKKVCEAESQSVKLEKEKLDLTCALQQSKSEIGELSEKMEEVWNELEQCKKDNKTMQEVELPGLREKVKELEEQLKKCGDEKKNPPAENNENKPPPPPPQVQGNGNSNRVFLDIASTRGSAAVRLVIELDVNMTPITAENFRELCTGQKGRDGSGTPISYKGSSLTHGNAFSLGGPAYTKAYPGAVMSIYKGSLLPAENLQRKLDRPGLVAMLNSDKAAGRSHASGFIITMAPARFFDYKLVVFGEVVEGLNVLREILKTEISVDIKDCGQL